MKKRKTRAQRSRSFRCPHCGAAMILRPASEIYHDAKSDRKLYVCHNYPACNTYVAAHPNTDKPMGVPANGDLRNLRIQAHRKFDLIWKNGIMTREEAYRWFADSFGLMLTCTSVDFDETVTDATAMSALAACKEKYNGVARKGVEAIEMKLKGYEATEIAKHYDMPRNPPPAVYGLILPQEVSK